MVLQDGQIQTLENLARIIGGGLEKDERVFIATSGRFDAQQVLRLVSNEFRALSRTAGQ